MIRVPFCINQLHNEIGAFRRVTAISLSAFFVFPPSLPHRNQMRVDHKINNVQASYLRGPDNPMRACHGARV